MINRGLKSLFVVCAMVCFLFGFSGNANALTMDLHYTGDFGPTTVLNGTALGVDTPFSYDAHFDSTLNLFAPGVGIGVYAATATFNIAGYGTYQSAPGADLAVLLTDPTFGLYGAGLSNLTVSMGYLYAFGSATPPFNAESPTPSIFGNPLGYLAIAPNFNIPFSNGLDSLVINDFGSATPTAELFNAPVPEPSTFLLLGAGLGGLALIRRKTRKL